MWEKLSTIGEEFLKKIQIKWKKYLENLEKFVTPFITIVQTNGKF